MYNVYIFIFSFFFNIRIYMISTKFNRDRMVKVACGKRNKSSNYLRSRSFV